MYKHEYCVSRCACFQAEELRSTMSLLPIAENLTSRSDRNEENNEVPTNKTTTKRMGRRRKVGGMDTVKKEIQNSGTRAIVRVQVNELHNDRSQ